MSSVCVAGITLFAFVSSFDYNCYEATTEVVSNNIWQHNPWYFTYTYEFNYERPPMRRQVNDLVWFSFSVYQGTNM